MDKDRKMELYLDLWKAENSIKTNKLMLYLTAQPLLALGASLQNERNVACYFFSTLGIFFSIWWFFCVGRTVGYQKLWKHKIIQIQGEEFFPSEQEKKEHLPWYARVSSNLIVLLPIVAGAIIWLIVLVYVCGSSVVNK
jgi:hypothetical protein